MSKAPLSNPNFREPPHGFRGLRRDLPVSVYRRRLPHHRQEGATYFFTFHTADALPLAAQQELEVLRQRWADIRRKQPNDAEEKLEALRKAIMKSTDQWLDRGHGRCVFREFAAREMLHDALLHFHQKRVEVGGFVIMPNHAHGVARPLGNTALENWLGSVKQFVSRRIEGKVSKEKGFEKFWFKESYDRIVRDVDHLENCISYMGRNPGTGAKKVASHVLWLNPEWQAQGWKWP